jgi:hypothetical protein
MNFYDVIFAQQKTKKDSKYFEEISDAINVLAGTETTYTPSEMGEAIIDAIPTETASGNPIHITDAAAYPAEECVTTLEPVQDLHGYDRPWPGGAGKNLAIMSDLTKFSSQNCTIAYQNNGVIVTATEKYARVGFSFDVIQDETYTVSFRASGTGDYNAMYVVMNSEWLSTQVIKVNDTEAMYNLTFTADSNIYYIGVYVTTESSTGEIIVKNFQLELGSTATAFEPYSNICPISGYTGVELTRTGKNLFDINGNRTYTYNNVEIANNKIIISSIGNGGTSRVYFAKQYKAGTYTFSANFSEYISNIRLFSPIEFSGSSYNSYYAGYFVPLSAKKSTVTFSTDFSIGIIVVGEPGEQGEVFDIQLELGSTATTYEPYQGETHSQTFPQAQSPVYGGMVDWVNGVLRVTHEKIILDGKNNKVSRGVQNGGVYQTEWYTYRSIGIPKAKYTSNIFELVEGEYRAPYTIYPAADNVNVRMFLAFPTTIVSDSDANAWLEENNVEVVCPLATPIEIPLTPEVITLLKGKNNVWTDSGTSEIKYKVDLNSYIQKLIDEASANASLSVSPLSFGKSAVVSTDGESEESNEPAEENKEADDLTVKEEITEELAETEKVEDIKETEKHESEVEEL